MINAQMKLFYFVDHTSRHPGNSGVQRVVRGLARALQEANCNLVFVAWCPRQKALVPIDRGMLKHLGKFQGPVLLDSEQAAYPANIEKAAPIHEQDLASGWVLVPEVTHLTYHDVPPTQGIVDYSARHGLKTAFIFYDAIPLKHQDYADAEPKHSAYMQQLALADLIIPISRFAADDLVSFYLNRLYFQVETLPSITPILLPAEMGERTKQMPIAVRDAPKLFLTVGTVESRKNQLALLQAFQQFCDEHPDNEARLVVIGGLNGTFGVQALRAALKNPRVTYIQDADDKVLSEYYAKCDFTVFPSVEEGYGLPIVESLWYGKPCICANFGSMAEVAEGGGCLTIDTRSHAAIYDALSTLLLDPDGLDALRKEIVGRKFLTWAEYGEQLRQAIREVEDPSACVKKIYYWVDHTRTYPSNSGIQRVVRALAASLQASSVPVIPVGWNAEEGGLVAVGQSELAHLEKWNGPAAGAWSCGLPGENETGAWLLVPELLTYGNAPVIPSIVAYAKERNMRTAIIFFDAIPYKLVDLYPVEAQRAHADYMRMLAFFDWILCISEQSRADLLNYLRSHLGRLVNVEQRVKAVLLPAEFPEVERQAAREFGALRGGVTIVSVGTLEPRKNHLALLEAFKRAKALTKIPMKLVLAGGAPFPDLAERVKDYCASDADITWLDHPDDDTLGDLYRSCDFTVYPSLEEGFGLPILESLWHARPCICRNASSMREIGEGGGCLLVETADPDDLAKAIVTLTEDPKLLRKLGEETTQRTFKTWRDYSYDVLRELAGTSDWHAKNYPPANVVPSRSAFHAPILSICISTYNRAPWLALSLPLLLKQTETYRDVVEVVVCDNASTDATQQVVKPYLDEPGFVYVRNPENVGMLGNLKVTAQHAQGQYVWILGDDDLLRHGAVERVMKAILEHPDVSLVYLNYAYTTVADADQVGNIDKFLGDATPIRPSSPDLFAPVSTLATLSENFFTAIYCLVYRRDHALRAYSQNVNGRPFSTLLTCIPTSYYVCQHMMKEAGYWIGEPSLVVNMNVSWGKYASLWVLERLPELYDLAELKGANPYEVDHWRVHNLRGVQPYLKQIYFSDQENNIEYFSMERFIARHKHLKEFRTGLAELVAVYQEAYLTGHPAARSAPADLLTRYGLKAD